MVQAFGTTRALTSLITNVMLITLGLYPNINGLWIKSVSDVVELIKAGIRVFDVVVGFEGRMEWIRSRGPLKLRELH